MLSEVGNSFAKSGSIMRYRGLLICSLLLVVGCTRQHSIPIDSFAKKKDLQANPRSAGFPGFRVDVTLSQSARRKLIESKETVVVLGLYSGTPTLESRRLHDYEMGEVGLGETTIEVAPGNTAKFGPITLNQEALKQTDHHEPQLLINVVSGRKSSENNLLNCYIYEGSLKAVQAKTIPIYCALIAEKYQMMNTGPIE